jgi:hypothetical protein
MKFALYVDIVQLFKTLDDSILCLNILVFMSMPITTHCQFAYNFIARFPKLRREILIF